MRPRGFNLFTALVSFVLIALSVLLINGMVQSESSAVERIKQEQNITDLQAFADMARADAMQVFNYGLREAIEGWLTDPETGGVTLNLRDTSWNDIKRSFVTAKFGGNKGSQFAATVSSALSNRFSGERHFGNYSIEMLGENTLREIVAILTARSAEEEDFFEVIECPTGDPKTCEKGTFYVNLNVAKLTDAEYEMLPRIIVTNKATGDQIQEIILPRANFRIYVPLRVFKAMAEARAFAHFPLNNGEINNAKDQGMFSARAHNIIDEMAIGMCDKGYCNPRGNPFQPPSSKSFKAAVGCPGDALPGESSQINWNGKVMVNLSNPWISGAVYDAADPDSGSNESMEVVMKRMVTKKVCDIAKDAVDGGWLDADKTDGMNLVGDLEGPTNCAYLKEIKVAPESMQSKNIITRNENKSPTGQLGVGGGGYSFDACPRQAADGHTIGLYREGGVLEYSDIEFDDLACSGNLSQEGQSYCTEVDSLEINLWFEETNETYIVDKASGNKKIYRIKLLDNTYQPFTANWDQGNVGSDCAYPGTATNTNCSLNQGWKCVTDYSEQFKVANGCSPA